MADAVQPVPHGNMDFALRGFLNQLRVTANTVEANYFLTDGSRSITPATDGGVALNITSSDGLRDMDVTVPADGASNDPFIFGTNNSWEFQVDGNNLFEISSVYNIAFNRDFVDSDFEIKKLGSGVAYKYDSGTDVHTWSGDPRFDDQHIVLNNADRSSANTTLVDLDGINSAGNEEIMMRLNNSSDNIAFGSYSGGVVNSMSFNLNQSTNEIFMNTTYTRYNAGSNDRDFQIYKNVTGVAYAYNAGLDSHKFDGDMGFYGATPVAKPTVTGARGGNAALTSLLTQLANLGLITDSTT